ncbi:EVE domain-containing protein [Kineosporia mesophila]|uniref:EVE domain-containing protein n=1 Tax=Kineosporia mesophila TaxID=566012 RepID=UPI001E5AD19F|nr:EVE domain-containing protein [Kineosporia mesophila]MCD5354138.1 EVE domain-containing protein [Kineosporia mesophila]
MSSPPARRVTESVLGAWLIKGNADAGALDDRFRADPHVTRWCVQRNYRSDLMREKHPVVFWASGSRSRGTPYGVWGLGHLTGPVFRDEQERWSVPLDLEILPPRQRLSRERFRAHPLLAGAEVLRQPQAGNPSFLTPSQFRALQALLEDLA